MSTPAYEIAQYLDAQGIGTWAASSGWAIATGAEPATPDDVITVYDTGGGPPIVNDDNIRNPTIQVRVRSYDYLGMEAKQQAVFDALNAVIGQDIGDHHYVGIWMTSDIIGIGRDENDRFLMTANYEIDRQPV